MSNATAAGPDRGLLEVLFGGKDKERPEADGTEFSGLMALIQQLKGKQDAEEPGGGLGRTLRETMAGKGAVENGAGGIPVWSAGTDASGAQLTEGLLSADAADESDRRQRLLQLAAAPPGGALTLPGMAVPLAPLPADQVNEVLRQKGLPPLSTQEQQLLGAVNGRIREVSAGAQSVGVPRELSPVPAGMGLPSAEAAMHPGAAAPVVGPDPLLQKAVAARGVDPRKLKLADAEISPVGGGTPEKLVSTESYLRMHEAMSAGTGAAAKGAAPEGRATEQGAHGVAKAAPQAPAQGAITASAVPGLEGAAKRRALPGRDQAEPADAGARHLSGDAAAAGGFGAALAKAPEAARHDVYLPGPEKPEQMRGVLLTELGSGVALHAHKGGGEMRLVIHPDELGEVKLKVGTRDGKVEVQVSAQNDEVARMIREGSGQLESSLKDQNLSLAKFEVTVSDASPVASTDTKSGLGEQFLSQNQQQSGSFPQQGGGSHDGQSFRWTGGGEQDGGGRQQSPYGAGGEPGGGAAPKPAGRSSRGTASAPGGGRRLDVVA